MTDKPTVITRRGLLGAFAATALVAAPTYANAAGFLRGAGDIRRLKMYSRRTGESLDVIYWIDGDYIKDALTEVNCLCETGAEISPAPSTPAQLTSSQPRNSCSTPPPHFSCYPVIAQRKQTRCCANAHVASQKNPSILMGKQQICACRASRSVKWPEPPHPAQPVGLGATRAQTLSISIAVKNASGAVDLAPPPSPPSKINLSACAPLPHHCCNRTSQHRFSQRRSFGAAARPI